MAYASRFKASTLKVQVRQCREMREGGEENARSGRADGSALKVQAGDARVEHQLPCKYLASNFSQPFLARDLNTFEGGVAACDAPQQLRRQTKVDREVRHSSSNNGLVYARNVIRR